MRCRYLRSSASLYKQLFIVDPTAALEKDESTAFFGIYLIGMNIKEFRDTLKY